VECALIHRGAFQLLVATILSAQCTDARVNQVTPVLFKKYSTPQALAKARLSDVEGIIRSTGFFHQKAMSIVGSARLLVEKFGGQVPKTMEKLLLCPGVARKTANVVLGTAYGISVGVVVDTHVRRLANRLGLTRQHDPAKIEKDLMVLVPSQDWIWFSHALITHGRKVCGARKPDCPSCVVRTLCPKISVA
jgi:endonuclease-3